MKRTMLRHKIMPQLRLRDPRTLNMEEYEGMGFDENNYSPIQPINWESPKLVTPRPTSTLKLDELILNRSDPTDNRGKVKRVNSFEIAQERAASLLKISKGGPVKSTGTKTQHRVGTSNQPEQRRPQLSCTACGGQDHLRKDCAKMCFAKIAEQGRIRQRCVERCHNRQQVTPYAYIVAVLATFLANVLTNPTTTEKSQGLLRETLGKQDQGWTITGWAITSS